MTLFSLRAQLRHRCGGSAIIIEEIAEGDGALHDRATIQDVAPLVKHIYAILYYSDHRTALCRPDFYPARVGGILSVETGKIENPGIFDAVQRIGKIQPGAFSFRESP